MALLMYLNKERFRPENPLVFDTHLNDDVFMSFVDLIPSVIKRSTTTAMTAGEVEYHSFREIVDLANSWLERNPNWTVFNCETVMLYYKFNDKMSYFELRPNDSNFYIYGSEKNNVLKALRIWVKRKRGRDKQYIDVQTLNYYDLLPESLNEYGKFENLDHLLARANEMIANREVQGNLITVESLICESSGAAWKVEPDVTLSSVSAKKMIVLRLFYQENLISPDTSIGIIDFIPRHLSGGGLFKRPKYEAFDDVISRAYVWLAGNDESVRLVNLKTLDLKLKSWTEIDTKICHYHEHGCYIRILRLAFARKAGRAPSIMRKLQSSSLDKEDGAVNGDGKAKANCNPITMESFNSSSSSSSNCIQQANKVPNIQPNQSNFRNVEHCYLHNEHLRAAVDKAIKEINDVRAAEQQVRHPDEETVPANEEEARKQMQQNERLAQQASQHCTCNDNIAYDKNDSSSNAEESNEKNDSGAAKKIHRSRKLYLNSKFFTPQRKNETIQQIQVRLHDFVNSMLTIKNLGNNAGNTAGNQAGNQAGNSPMTPTTARLPSSTVDGSAMIIQQHQQHQQLLQNQMHGRRKSRAFSTQAGVNDHHLSLFAGSLDNHSNGTASRKTSTAHHSTAGHHNQPPLIDQDVHCNVVCAETINMFCKSIEIDLNAEQNETFQYNRFGTRNGYIIVAFRIYYDSGSDSHIVEYQNRMKEESKQQAKTIKLKIEQSKAGGQMQIKHELVDADSLNERATKRKHLSFNNRTGESMCCVS